MSMHYDSESLVDRGRSPRLFALLDMVIKLICVIKCDLSDLDDLSDLGDMSDLCDLCDLRDT